MRKLIWICLLFPFFGIEAQENIRVNANPEAARYYFVLNNEGFSPYRDGRVAFFKNGRAYTAVLNEKLEKTDIKPAPELDGLGIERRFTYDPSRNKIYFSKDGELYSVITNDYSNRGTYNPRSGGYRFSVRKKTPKPIEFVRIESERETLRGSSIAYAGWRYKPEDVKIEGQRFSNPVLSSDGKTLYYTAESPETTGRPDIWYSTLEKGGIWSMPVNLEENANTALDERIATLLIPETEKVNNEQPLDKQSPVLANVNDSNRDVTEEIKPETKPESKPETKPGLADLNEASSKIYIKDPKTFVFLFDYDNDQMVGAYREEIDVLLKFLEHYKDNKYLIIGYTDERGSEKYNQVLSEKRAKKLYQILIERGIPKEKMNYIGKGKADPVVKGAQTEDQHQQNRRVEIRIVD